MPSGVDYAYSYRMLAQHARSLLSLHPPCKLRRVEVAALSLLQALVAGI